MAKEQVRLLSEEQIEKERIEKVRQREHEGLLIAFTPVNSFSQMIGNQPVETCPKPGQYLMMERNMSMIHLYEDQEDGTAKRKWSQMIRDVNRIYYFD
jgi:hypothetical protein